MSRTPGPWRVGAEGAAYAIRCGVGSAADALALADECDRLKALNAELLAALRTCLLATAAHVGPGHIEAYNAVRSAIEEATGEPCRQPDPPEAVAWARLSATAPELRDALQTILGKLERSERITAADEIRARAALLKSRGALSDGVRRGLDTLAEGVP